MFVVLVIQHEMRMRRIICITYAKREGGDILFGTLNVRSLCGAGSFTAAAGELASYKLHLVGVQEVTWDKEGTVRAKGIIISLQRARKKTSIRNTIFVCAGMDWIELAQDRDR